MDIEFYKYQGTGNDFVMIDNRSLTFSKNNTKLINQLCDRKFGVGADGLILLELHDTCDFKMVYYNADGYESSMCGNGGRCIVHFAHYLGLVNESLSFEAIDGLHIATIKNGIVSLKMNDVQTLDVVENGLFLDTGSPHHVALVSNLDVYPVVQEGRAIRNGQYGAMGSNVNFVEKVSDDHFKVRTYERGVEDETLSCGTGVTAVAIAMSELKHTDLNQIQLETPGGILKVSFKKADNGYSDVFLEGPATQVYKGLWI